MAIRALNEFIPIQLQKNDGTINAGGKLEFYENLTLTPINVYAESTLITNLGSSITLDGAGRWLSSEVWLPTVVRIRCKDSALNILWTLDNINLDTTASGTVSGGNLVTNGSFEIDSNADNLPDGWTLTAYTGATNALDATTQSDGAKSLKSTSAGNGGGAWLHDAYIEIDDKAKYTADYDLKSSVAAADDVRIIVELLWYDAAKTQLGGGSASTTLYDDASDNPATFTHFQNNVTPPAGARYCRPRVILCDPSDATAGSAWCDAFSLVKQPGALNLPGNFNVGGTIGASGDISPAQITANQNDYNPAGLSAAAILRLNSDAARSITGISGGSDGRIIKLFNIGSFNITLKDEDTGSTAANRFTLTSDFILYPNTSCSLWYDATTSRWRMASSAVSGWDLIEILTANNSSELDAVLGFNGNYAEHEFVFDNILPATDGASLYSRVSTDGTTFPNGAADYVWQVRNQSNLSTNMDTTPTGTATEINLVGTNGTAGIDNTSAAGFCGNMSLFGADSGSKKKRFKWEAVYEHNAAGTSPHAGVNGSGAYVGSNTALQKVRFFMSAGNINSGVIYHWARRK